MASSFAGPRIGEGDEIVLTIMEHHSNIVPWHFHRERKGAVLKWVDVRDDGSFDLDAFEKALGPKTRMVAVTHMSNVLGTVTPLKQIIEMAHARNIPVLVDGSQGAVHEKVDVQDLDADFYIFTGHKLYGPTGIGVLYGKYELLAEMQPYQGGGEMIDTVSMDAVTYNEPPHRFRGGDAADRAGHRAGRRHRLCRGRRPRRDDGARSRDDRLWHGKAEPHHSLRLIGTAPGKGGIFSFEITGAHAHDVSTIWIAMASPCGPAPIVPCRCSSDSGLPPPAAPPWACTAARMTLMPWLEGIEKARTFFS